MLPAAAVSGLYFWHPGSHYFGLGRIGRDQLDDYARRAGMPGDEATRWLGPHLADVLPFPFGHHVGQQRAA